MLFGQRRPPLRFLGYGAVLLGCFLLQAGLGLVWPGRPVPLLAPPVVAAAMEERMGPAAGFGAAAGLLWDAMGGGLFGGHALYWMLAAAAVSLATEYWLRRNRINALLLGTVCLLAESLLRLGLAALSWQEAGLWQVWAQRGLPAVLLGALLCPLCCGLLRKLAEWLHRPEKGEW